MSLAAKLAAVSTGKLRLDGSTVAVLVINFYVAHLLLSFAGTEVLIDTVQGSSRVHHNVVG